jgi:hypothetical protein
MKLSRAPARAYPFRQRMHALILPATRAGGLAFLVRQAERERKAAEDGGGGPEVAPETESEEEEEEKEEEEEEVRVSARLESVSVAGTGFWTRTLTWRIGDKKDLTEIV